MTLETYSIIINILFIVLIGYLFYLYHKAHGKESSAVKMGADIVLSSLQRQGRIMGQEEDDKDMAFNIEDDFSETPVEEKPAIPDIIVARSEKAAQQIGEVELSKVMKEMDDKI
jgi:hypothetical protein